MGETYTLTTNGGNTYTTTTFTYNPCADVPKPVFANKLIGVIPGCNIEVFGRPCVLTEAVMEAFSDLYNAKVQAFEIDWNAIKEIRFLDSLAEYKFYYAIGENKHYYSACAFYEPNTKSIYMLSEQLVKMPWEHTVMIALHELSHSIMNTHDIFSRARYGIDPVYRWYEELRVNNMSAYLAKHLYEGETLRTALQFTWEYGNMCRSHIAHITFFENHLWQRYLTLGRGITTLFESEGIEVKEDLLKGE